jgi:hypothetical protein
MAVRWVAMWAAWRAASTDSEWAAWTVSKLAVWWVVPTAVDSAENWAAKRAALLDSQTAERSAVLRVDTWECDLVDRLVVLSVLPTAVSKECAMAAMLDD